MSGEFTSEPYHGEDWSGKGREVFYMDMDIKEMIHPVDVHYLHPKNLPRRFLTLYGIRGTLVSFLLWSRLISCRSFGISISMICA